MIGKNKMFCMMQYFLQKQKYLPHEMGIQKLTHGLIPEGFSQFV